MTSALRSRRWVADHTVTLICSTGKTAFGILTAAIRGF